MERLSRLLAGHRRRGLGVLCDCPFALGFRRRPRQADRQEGAGPALPARHGEVPLRQRVGVRPILDEVGRKLAQPLARVLQGPLQPLGGDDLVVPRPLARVHRGDGGVPQVAVGPQRVEGCLGNRRRVAALRAQGAPAFERLRPPRLDLDDHLVAVGGRGGLVPEEERLRRRLRADGLALGEGHPPRGVGVSRHQQVRADLHRHLSRVLGVGGVDLPAGPFHRPQDDGFEGVAGLHRRERLLGRRIGGFVARRRVPEGAAAAQGRRGAHLKLPVPVEPCGGAGEDLSPVNVCRHVDSSLLPVNGKRGRPRCGDRPASMLVSAPLVRPSLPLLLLPSGGPAGEAAGPGRRGHGLPPSARQNGSARLHSTASILP